MVLWHSTATKAITMVQTSVYINQQCAIENYTFLMHLISFWYQNITKTLVSKCLTLNGIAFPDHVAIPDFSAGAMENWGLVLYRETALLHDEEVSSISNKYWVSLVMAHEIAHTAGSLIN